MAQVFVELADTLVDEFDTASFLDRLTNRCVELLDVDAVGLLLVSGGRDGVKGDPLASAGSPEALELQTIEGPCLMCCATGVAVTNLNLDAARNRWPEFASAALETGFEAAHALPMRLRGRVIGALSLFTRQRDQMSDADIAVAQAMADVATIGLVHHRDAAEQRALSAGLQVALDNRILVEQTKGMLAATANVTLGEAFARMRAYAHRNNRLIVDVAAAVIEGAPPGDLLTS